MDHINGNNCQQGQPGTKEVTVMTAVAKVSSKGQITVPMDVRKHLNVIEGDNIQFRVLGDGQVKVEGIRRKKISQLIGILPIEGELADIHTLREEAARELANNFTKETAQLEDE